MTLTATAPAPTELVIDTLLHRAIDMGASDLHLAADSPPWVSVNGETKIMEGVPSIPGPKLAGILKQLAGGVRWGTFERENRLDFSHQTHLSFYRCHYGVNNRQPNAVFRMISLEVPDLENLGLPAAVAKFADAESGLYLFAGVTGSGKSSSLAGVLKLAREKHAKKIVTLENPIEFRHPHSKSMVIQREVGTDVKDFPTGIEDAMREAPDIILVGEMRDSETMRAAISAATSGHTVFSTIHCESTADAPTRILDSIEAARVADVRSQLSRSLKAVVYQKLLPKKGGDGRALATELMLVNPAISNAIRTNELGSIQGQLNNKETGSIPFEVSLANLFHDGLVNESVARNAEIKPGSFDRQKVAGRRAI